LPTLFNPLRRALGTVYADGAYDTKACHELIKRKGAKACIPPRKNAGLWEVIASSPLLIIILIWNIYSI
jgi:hypothetical protein